MPLKLGTTRLAGGYLGTTPIIAMYQGSELVFKAGGEYNPVKALIERTIEKVDVELTNEITSIKEHTFDGCENLKTVILPSSITSIGEYAFYGCSSLTTMTILAETPPTLSNQYAISSATTTIYVPASSVEAYQTATMWKDLMTRTTNPVTFVGI